MDDEFEPVIVGYFCNWCTATAADLAGTTRMQYPPNIRPIPSGAFLLFTITIGPGLICGYAEIADWSTRGGVSEFGVLTKIANNKAFVIHVHVSL